MAYASITKPGLHFNTKATTGTGNSQAVTGLGFQPDLIWGKRRDDAGHHSWFDAVRGITKGMESNRTDPQFTSTDYYSSFDSDGFTIAAGSSGVGNGNGQTAVQWCWKANGAGSANTDGDVNATVSANTTAGFSMVKFNTNGQSGTFTVGHGLNAVPKMMILKPISTTDAWWTYHNFLGNAKYLKLNTTDAEASNSNIWGSTTPTSSVFSLNVGFWGANTNDILAYCFAEKKGYSKIGSYIGNGNTDGPFIYTGFKPAFVMIKNHTTGAYSWTINDTARTPNNVMDKWLYPNTNIAEATGSSYNMDLLSNGFISRNTGSNTNDNNNGYVYMAFAENPIVANVGSSIPATAR